MARWFQGAGGESQGLLCGHLSAERELQLQLLQPARKQTGD